MTCYTPRWWWRRQWNWVSPVHSSGHLTSICHVLFFMLTIIDHLTNRMPARFHLPQVDTIRYIYTFPATFALKFFSKAIATCHWAERSAPASVIAVWIWDGENTSSEMSWQVATLLAKQVTYFKPQNWVSIPVILPPTVSVYPEQKGTDRRCLISLCHYVPAFDKFWNWRKLVGILGEHYSP